jgi:hemolysin III
MSIRIYTPKEELLNIYSHVLGLLAAVICAPYLIYKSTFYDNNNLFCLFIYAISLIAVYTTSILYHHAKDESTKLKYKLYDHLCIFFLIGGSYMPLISKFFNPEFSFIFLSFLWTLILIGVLLKLFVKNKYNKYFSAIIYSIIGCLALFIIEPVQRQVPTEIFMFILYGGAFYLGGLIFYLWKKREFTHFIWHCFVLCGSICHFIAIYKAIQF